MRERECVRERERERERDGFSYTSSSLATRGRLGLLQVSSVQAVMIILTSWFMSRSGKSTGTRERETLSGSSPDITSSPS